MAEANKCDVVNCGEFSEGSPAGRFTVSETGASRGMCKSHSDQIVATFFPDLSPKVEEKPVEDGEANAAGEQPAA